MPERAAAGPLSGLMVLDLSSLAPGPYGALLLAEFGADVIKVERPGWGDPSRQVDLPEQDGSAFDTLNPRKRSVAIDLKTTEGRAILRRLVMRADILVENFLPDTAERLGVVPAQLHKHNPRLVVCSVHGFATGSAWEGLPGHDVTFWAASGSLDVSALPDEPVLPVPTYPASDIIAGLAVAMACAAGVVQSQRTGVGEAFDVSMSELMTHGWVAMGMTPSGRSEAGGFENPILPGRAVYRAADGGLLAFAAEEPRYWRQFCELVGLEDLASLDPLAPADDAVARISDVLRTRDTDEWNDLFASAGVPVIKVTDPLAAARDNAGRGLTVTTARGGAPSLVPMAATQSSNRSPSAPAPAPRFGENTRAIMAEVGFTDTEIDSFARAGIVQLA